MQGRWSLTSSIFRSEADPRAQRRTLAELLLERYGILTRETVLGEGIPGGFSALYDALTDLETLGVCRRGYFVEGLGGAQFALPGAVERLRAAGETRTRRRSCSPRPIRPRPTARRCPGPSATASTGGRPASPAPTSSSSAPSRRSTSSAGAAA